MAEYRRGVTSKRKNDLWHWAEECPSYPRQAFAIRMTKPPADALCSKCAAYFPPGRDRVAS